MKRDNVNYLLVGTFVLAMLGALLVGLYFVTGRSGPSDAYYVTYPHVTGIKFGTPVYFEGYPVGQVEDVEPVAGSGPGLRYRVEISVSRGWPIPRDSVARMMATGLLAALSINISQGTSTDMLSPGEDLKGEAGGDLFSVLHTVAIDLNELAQTSLRPLLDNLNLQLEHVAAELSTHGPLLLSRSSELLERLHASAGQLEAMLSDANRRQVEAIIGNARLTSDNALEMSEGGVRFVAELNRLAADVNQTRSRVDALLAELQGVVDDNRSNIKISLRDLRRTLDVTARNVDQVAYHLKGTTRNMHEFSRQIRQNPGVLLGGKPPAEAAEVAE
ncbi:MAG: MlaD family protein [Gammaproteobacteria bacterium]|nr:MlaD family protein [Gammaproteobacteria bacterium]